MSDDRTIQLADYVNFADDIEWYYAGAVAHILPKPGKLDKVGRHNLC